ncbi:MAG: 4Fe-4S dicluster domain-containing protein [Dehalococcoidales bacterium]|nr:4Fe-4S dicluster domain-containing protein [Dehalococcoidales bacterium]
MDISRGDFIKTLMGATGLMLLRKPAIKATSQSTSSVSEYAILVDVSKCVGCWWCFAACKNYNNLPEEIKPESESPPELSSKTWTTLSTVNINNRWVYRKHACMHCTDAACVKVCPAGALNYTEEGYVLYDRDKCIGCGYCAEFCPYEIPKLENNKITGIDTMSKCTFCKERIENGQQPACVEACPTGALKFGKRQELLEEAKERVKELSKKNRNACLYGEYEMGGLHVLYVLPDKPSVYSLPEMPISPASLIVQKDIFHPLAWISWGVIAAGLAVNLLVVRARQLKKKEGG